MVLCYSCLNQGVMRGFSMTGSTGWTKVMLSVSIISQFCFLVHCVISYTLMLARWLSVAPSVKVQIQWKRAHASSPQLQQSFPDHISSDLMRYLIFQVWVSCPFMKVGVQSTPFKALGLRMKKTVIPMALSPEEGKMDTGGGGRDSKHLQLSYSKMAIFLIIHYTFSPSFSTFQYHCHMTFIKREYV